jgi:type I restriction enzyme S subunit
MSRRNKNKPIAHWEWPVPKSWTWVRISEVADVISGGTPSTMRYEFWEGGKIPWITPADLTGYNEREISRGARYITQAGLDNSSAHLLPARSVLFSSRAPVGYVAIAANPLATNQGFKSFVLSEGILPEYVYFYLRRAKEEITKLASGTTFVEISARACASIPLPIAPSDEQARIVAKLDTLLSRVAAGEAAARRALERLKRYRAAILHAAVTGELTHDWRKSHKPAETGPQLLKRLLQERRARWEESELKRLRTNGKSPKGDKWKLRYPEPKLLETSVGILRSNSTGQTQMLTISAPKVGFVKLMLTCRTPEMSVPGIGGSRSSS